MPYLRSFSTRVVRPSVGWGLRSTSPASPNSRRDQKGTPAAEMTDDEFAAEFRDWLDANLVGEFAEIKGVGGPGSEHEFFPQRLAWERHMAAAGWTCVGWPTEHGGRGASLAQQVVALGDRLR